RRVARVAGPRGFELSVVAGGAVRGANGSLAVNRAAGLVWFGVMLCASVAEGQGGGPYLFVLDLQGTALDEFPTGVKSLSGVMTVVDKGGRHMLRASSP